MSIIHCGTMHRYILKRLGVQNYFLHCLSTSKLILNQHVLLSTSLQFISKHWKTFPDAKKLLQDEETSMKTYYDYNCIHSFLTD
jgi:hypothetical protein